MDETVNPFEATLTFGVDMTKDDFVGKKALEKVKTKVYVGRSWH
jgi:glycine cleavage system aminomethyltransferase T